MRCPAVRVHRTEGEATRRRLREAHALRDDLRIASDGEWVVLPVRTGAAEVLGLESLTEAEFDAVPPARPRDYRQLFGDWSEEERANLPRAYDVVGEVVLVRIPPSLAPRGREVGEALLRFVPGARLVGSDDGVQGPQRVRELTRLSGSGPWRTHHRENGIDFDVDPSRAYFSPRLANEHARVAREVRKGDTVFDLCCGVGPFALTIARAGHSARIAAVDSNPRAIELLRATADRYPYGSRVHPVVADIAEFLSTAGTAQDVVLNLPREGIKYLPLVGNAVSSGGRLFFYDVTDRRGAERRPAELLEQLGGSSRWVLGGRRVVHPYSPGADLVSYTFQRRSE